MTYSLWVLVLGARDGMNGVCADYEPSVLGDRISFIKFIRQSLLESLTHLLQDAMQCGHY